MVYCKNWSRNDKQEINRMLTQHSHRQWASVFMYWQSHLAKIKRSAVCFVNDSWISEEDCDHLNNTRPDSHSFLFDGAMHIKIHLAHFYRADEKKKGWSVTMAHRQVPCCTLTGSNITHTHNRFRCGNLWEKVKGDEAMELQKTENIFLLGSSTLTFSVDIQVRSAPYSRGSQRK